MYMNERQTSLNGVIYTGNGIEVKTMDKSLSIDYDQILFAHNFFFFSITNT